MNNSNFIKTLVMCLITVKTYSAQIDFDNVLNNNIGSQNQNIKCEYKEL